MQNGFGKYLKISFFLGIYISKVEELTYTGFWKDGLMHGKGVTVWNDGKIYDGNYIDGQKEG